MSSAALAPTEMWMSAKDGHEIYSQLSFFLSIILYLAIHPIDRTIRLWDPPNYHDEGTAPVVATMVLVHGVGEHVGRLEHPIKDELS